MFALNFSHAQGDTFSGSLSAAAHQWINNETVTSGSLDVLPLLLRKEWGAHRRNNVITRESNEKQRTRSRDLLAWLKNFIPHPSPLVTRYRECPLIFASLFVTFIFLSLSYSCEIALKQYNRTPRRNTTFFVFFFRFPFLFLLISTFSLPLLVADIHIHSFVSRKAVPSRALNFCLLPLENKRCWLLYIEKWLNLLTFTRMYIVHSALTKQSMLSMYKSCGLNFGTSLVI